MKKLLFTFISICLPCILFVCGCGAPSNTDRIPVQSREANDTGSASGSGAGSLPASNESGAEAPTDTLPSSSSDATSPAYSGIFTLPRLVADHMVLQRNADIRIWGGYSRDGEVTVTFNGKDYKGSCKNGSFEVMIKTGGAGGPYTLTLSAGNDRYELRDILVGDVYLCSGQSNMHMQVGALKDDTLRNTPVPDKIRLFHVWTAPAAQPQEDFEHAYTAWVKTDDSNIGQYDSFSAVAYIFGKSLYEKYKIPIGIIQACEGDTIAAAWMPEKDAKTVNKINQSEDALQRHRPSHMYNGMIHPLRKYAVKGVLWYQGESDLGNDTYQQSLTTLINAWRREFQNPGMTFTVIQLPRFGGANWFDLRHQQKAAALAITNCTYSVNIDCGEVGDIHPQDKETVGIRAAQATMRAFYQETGYKQNPVYQSHSVQGNKIIVSFSNVDKGLCFETQKVPGESAWEAAATGTGFEIKNVAGVYIDATAVLQGNTLVLTSTEAYPKGIRYAYGNFPHVSLFDKNGLPAEQFSLDF